MPFLIKHVVAYFSIHGIESKGEGVNIIKRVKGKLRRKENKRISKLFL